MATRYWVGGSGTWDATTTTNWSATSGGSGGASAPTSSDDVVIDSNSGTGSNTITAASGAVCANFTYDSAATIVCSGYIQPYGTFAMDAFASAALASLQVGLYGSTIRGAYNSYIQWITCLNAGTTTFTGNVAARRFYMNGATVNLDGNTLYTNDFQGSPATLSNGDVRFSGFNSSYHSLYIRGVWSTVTVYVETGTYAPIVDVSYAFSGTAADLGDIVFNANATSAINTLTAKNITINAGTLNDSVLSIACYGNFYLASAASLTFSSYGQVNINKVSGSPSVTRTLRMDGDAVSGSAFFNVSINAGTDSITVTGDGNGLGSAAHPLSIGVQTTATFNCTSIYATNLTVSPSVVCDISTLTSVNVSFFSNYSVSLLPGSCAVNLTDYNGFGIGGYRSSAVTISAVTIVDPIAVHFYGSNTMGSLTCASSLGDGSGKALEFDPGSTQTVTGSFVLSGASASDTVSLGIYGSGSAATISKPSGTVTAAYATISYSNATGGALFKAPLTTNVDGGNNTGWIFTAAGGGANFFNFF